jgi:hypothetical protein
MIKAIHEMAQVTAFDASADSGVRTVTFSMTLDESDDKVVYVVQFLDDSTESEKSFEEALALLLDLMRERVEKRREELLSSVNQVLSKHRGALKGVRSRLRGKS